MFKAIPLVLSLMLAGAGGAVVSAPGFDTSSDVGIETETQVTVGQSEENSQNNDSSDDVNAFLDAGGNADVDVSFGDTQDQDQDMVTAFAESQSSADASVAFQGNGSDGAVQNEPSNPNNPNTTSAGLELSADVGDAGVNTSATADANVGTSASVGW